MYVNYYHKQLNVVIKLHSRLIQIMSQSAFSCSFLYIASPVKRIGY